MKRINKSHLRSLLTIFFLASIFSIITGQTTMPDALLKSTVREQIKYLNDKTLIYEGYRAIREDMFQKLTTNFSDTLAGTNARINNLNVMVSGLKLEVDSLKAELQATKSSLETAVTTKNSIRLFGFEVNKTSYNTIMWLTIIVLAVMLGIVFTAFKRSLAITRNTQKELKDLNDEYLAYKKTAREAREKMSMDHFNELKKMRGG
jgi:hypothetical protein